MSLDDDAALMESTNCEVKLAGLETPIDKSLDGMGAIGESSATGSTSINDVCGRLMRSFDVLKTFGDATSTPMIDKGLDRTGTMEGRGAMGSNAGRGATGTPMIDKGLDPSGTMEGRDAMGSNAGRGATGSSAGTGATGSSTGTGATERSGSTSINGVCGRLTRSLDALEDTALMDCVFPLE